MSRTIARVASSSRADWILAISAAWACTSCAALLGEDPAPKLVDPDLPAKERHAEDVGAETGAENAAATEALSEVLSTFVDADGNISYVALRTHRQMLDRYLDSLVRVPADRFATWSRNDQLAFWINAYNGFVIDTMIRHHPISRSGWLKGLGYPSDSIQQIDGVFATEKHAVLDRHLSLDEIRDGILRKDFRDPRILFALVNGARSSPPLRQQPYAGSRLDAELARQIERFLSDPTRGVAVDQYGRVIRISKIFDWYAGDFRDGYSTERFVARAAELRPALEFMATYGDARLVEAFEGKTYDVKFMDFDWAQNRSVPVDDDRSFDLDAMTGREKDAVKKDEPR